MLAGGGRGKIHWKKGCQIRKLFILELEAMHLYKAFADLLISNFELNTNPAEKTPYAVSRPYPSLLIKELTY